MSKKKIYDVKPPRRHHVQERKIKEFFSEEPVKRSAAGKNKKDLPAGRQAKRSLVGLVATVSAVALLSLAGYLYITLPKANIELWPKLDTLSFQQTVTVDTSVEMVDIAKSVIPGQYFEVEAQDQVEFPSTGNATDEGKASGTITIFNKYNPPAPLTLKTGTHFMSDSGNLFVSLQKAVIPAATKNGSKITPGSIKVKVEAVEGGDAYNIPASNFSIPGLKGTAYYFNVYASSNNAMSGGYSGKIKKVTDSDIQTAKEVLTKKLATKALEDLNKKIPSDYIISDNTTTSESKVDTNQVKPGTVAQNFTMNGSVKTRALAFKKSDIDEFVKKYLVSKMPDGKTLMDTSIKEEYSASSLDISSGKVTLKVNFSSDIYEAIDKNALTLSLIGQDAGQIQQTVNSMFGENISKTAVNFWPFWVKKNPNNQKVIHIYLRFN